MARKRREMCDGNVYHVFNRGVGRQIIFEGDEDRKRFMWTLRRFMAEFDGELYAYCLMSNHFHLLIHMDLGDISKLMKKVCVSYALYFNRKYDRVGTLFQDRFGSEPISDDAYLMTVVCYIHQNPVKAGITKGCTYKWSSYSEYATGRRAFVDTKFVTAVFGGVGKLIRAHRDMKGDDECLGPKAPYRVSDAYVSRRVRELFRELDVTGIFGVDARKRNYIIRYIKSRGILVNQLARVLGIGRSIVRYA